MQKHDSENHHDNAVDLETSLLHGVDEKPSDDSESWLISYTDMVTLLITLFLFMLAHSAYLRSSDKIVPHLIFENLKIQAMERDIPLNTSAENNILNDDPRLRNLQSGTATLALAASLNAVLSGTAPIHVHAETVTLDLKTLNGTSDITPTLRLVASVLKTSSTPVTLVDTRSTGTESATYALRAMETLRLGDIPPERLHIIIPAMPTNTSPAHPAPHLQIILD